MKFCTAINCMDGRVQLPVIEYLQKKFKADYVDTITEAGPNLILSEGSRHRATANILERLKISIEKHESVGVAIVGHHDCAGNPAPYDEQVEQIKMAIRVLEYQFGDIEIIGLWVDENWAVSEIE